MIMKYTGKMPTITSPPENSRSATPSFRGFNSFRQKGFGTRSPLPSPSRFIQQQGGMEALFQGAAKSAKGVLDRSERLGINQAVRDAVGEIRRNLNEARYTPKSPREILSEEGPIKGIAALESRNRQLATMLDETVASLKMLSTSNLDDKAKSLEIIELAAAKIQFVKIYLEDTSMEVPVLESPPCGDLNDVTVNVSKSPAGKDSTTSTAPDVEISGLKLADENSGNKNEESTPASNFDAMDTSVDEVLSQPGNSAATLDVRPAAPIPTRSTLAQSSFSWMLEPDESTPARSPVAASKSPSSQHRKRISNSASRERNAFLFGEVTKDAEGRNPLGSDDIFGMEPIRKSKSP